MATWRPRKGNKRELAADVAAFGMALEESDDEREEELYDVWEENLRTLQIFQALSTQWRWAVGFGIARKTGLVYQSIETLLRVRRVPRREHQQTFDDLRLMESAYLDEADRVAKNNG